MESIKGTQTILESIKKLKVLFTVLLVFLWILGLFVSTTKVGTIFLILELEFLKGIFL